MPLSQDPSLIRVANVHITGVTFGAKPYLSSKDVLEQAQSLLSIFDLKEGHHQATSSGGIFCRFYSDLDKEEIGVGDILVREVGVQIDVKQMLEHKNSY